MMYENEYRNHTNNRERAELENPDLGRIPEFVLRERPLLPQ